MSFKDKREFIGVIKKQIDDVLNYLDLANPRLGNYYWRSATYGVLVPVKLTDKVI